MPGKHMKSRNLYQTSATPILLIPIQELVPSAHFHSGEREQTLGCLSDYAFFLFVSLGTLFEQTYHRGESINEILTTPI